MPRKLLWNQKLSLQVLHKSKKIQTMKRKLKKRFLMQTDMFSPHVSLQVSFAKNPFPQCWQLNLQRGVEALFISRGCSTPSGNSALLGEFNVEPSGVSSASFSSISAGGDLEPSFFNYRPSRRKQDLENFSSTSCMDNCLLHGLWFFFIWLLKLWLITT